MFSRTKPEQNKSTGINICPLESWRSHKHRRAHTAGLKQTKWSITEVLIARINLDTHAKEWFNSHYPPGYGLQVPAGCSDLRSGKNTIWKLPSIQTQAWINHKRTRFINLRWKRKKPASTNTPFGTKITMVNSDRKCLHIKVERSQGLNLQGFWLSTHEAGNFSLSFYRTDITPFFLYQSNCGLVIS